MMILSIEALYEKASNAALQVQTINRRRADSLAQAERCKTSLNHSGDDPIRTAESVRDGLLHTST